MAGYWTTAPPSMVSSPRAYYYNTRYAIFYARCFR